MVMYPQSEGITVADNFAKALECYLCEKYANHCRYNTMPEVDDPCPSCFVYEIVGFTSKE